jgi:translation initiation factor eIF-2B subunit delta
MMSGEPSSSISAPNGDTPSTPTPSGSKSQKSMTKAERRELQEKQRAAKAAAKSSGDAQASSSKSKQAVNAKPAQNPPGSPAPKHSPAPKKPTRGTDGVAQGKTAPPIDKHRASKDRDTSTIGDDSRQQGLRIFSHFGLTKPVSGKGDIHPAIVRLALQFSEFKISGANARCIATLTAFKTVRAQLPLKQLSW